MVATVCYADESRVADAVRGRNMEMLKSLIAAKADVNAPLPDGSTALAWAAYEDDTAAVELLLNAHAKAAVADEYGETPLSLASANGNAAIVKKLLEAGADANAARWNGETPLMLASRAGNPAAVQLLLERGAKADAVEARKGQNALMWAAAEGHAEACALLLKSGASPNSTSKGGFSPLIFAVESGDSKTVATLLDSGADVNYAVPAGMNSLLISMASRRADLAEMLIKKGADPTAKDRNGSTLLHSAAEVGDVDMAKGLIARGLDVNAKTAKSQGGRGGGRNAGPGEQTPLMIAARNGHVELMHALVGAGADPKVKAQDGTTLLIAAAASGHLDVVKYAHELVPDVTAATDRGQTAVHAAIGAQLQNTTPEEICAVIKFLAEKGADLNAPDGTGKKPLTLAPRVDGAADLIKSLLAAK